MRNSSISSTQQSQLVKEKRRLTLSKSPILKFKANPAAKSLQKRAVSRNVLKPHQSRSMNNSRRASS